MKKFIRVFFLLKNAKKCIHEILTRFSVQGGVMRKMRNETFNILTQLKYHVQ